MSLRVLSATLLLATVACSGGHSDVKVSFDSSAATVAAAEPLGAGDVRVKSIDGSFVMSLVGDSVRMQLSDSLRQSVRHDIDTSADSSGFGGMVARSVSGIVSSAMGFVVRIPVQDIENVRYENGQIRFDTKHGGHVSVDNDNNNRTDERRNKAQFTAADGERFVAAVKARQQQLGTANR